MASDPMRFPVEIDFQLTVAVLKSFHERQEERVGFRFPLDHSTSECLRSIDKVDREQLWMMDALARAEVIKRERARLIDWTVSEFLEKVVRPKVEEALKKAIEAKDTKNGYTKEQDAAFFGPKEEKA